MTVVLAPVNRGIDNGTYRHAAVACSATSTVRGRSTCVPLAAVKPALTRSISGTVTAGMKRACDWGRHRLELESMDDDLSSCPQHAGRLAHDAMEWQRGTSRIVGGVTFPAS